jgi:hypothetical protein
MVLYAQRMVELLFCCLERAIKQFQLRITCAPALQVVFSSVSEAKARASALLALTYDPRWGQGVELRPLAGSNIAKHMPLPSPPGSAAGSFSTQMDMHRWELKGNNHLGCAMWSNRVWLWFSTCHHHSPGELSVTHSFCYCSHFHQQKGTLSRLNLLAA